jgi:replicative DNA helicase
MINEARLLSAIMNNRDIAPVLNSTNVDMLFSSYGDVWEYAKQYYQQNRAVVPPGIVKEEFPDFEHIEETPGTVKHYLEQLRDEFQTNMLERIARGLAKGVGTASNKDLINTVQKYMSDLTKATSGIKDLDITDTEKSIEHYTDMKERMEKNGGVLGIRSGFDSIDASYPTGWAGGQYVMIMSRTNQGKSWFALDLAINAHAQGFKVLYVSLEMTPQSVRDRAYTFMSEGQFKMSDLSRAQIDMSAMDSWVNGKFQSNGSFVVTSSDGMGDFSPSHLQAKVDQYAPDIVFIDYLQLMSDNRGSQGETERIRNASKELKSFSLSNDIPVIAVVSASSNETKEYNKPPEIYEVAYSRQAAFDADLVLSMFSNKQHDGSHLTEICAKKNRNGPLFDFKVRLDIEGGKITEEWGAEEDDPFDEL